MNFRRAGKTESAGRRSRPFVPALTVALTVAISAISVPASSDVVVKTDDISAMVDSAVVYFFQKEINRAVIDAACYFDPEVENSMRCSWASTSGGGDAFALQQKVKRQATKWCKQAGGENCFLFWRNGTLRFDGLSARADGNGGVAPRQDRHPRSGGEPASGGSRNQ